jgi:hypothetical protein
MTFRRLAVSLVSVCALVACSDEEAIIALNVKAGADVPVVNQLHVTITQGSREYVHDFAPPTEKGTAGAGPSIQDSFFERITLPESFIAADAVVQVEARRAGGAPFDPPLTDRTTVRIEEDGVVAAYVELKFPTVVQPPPNVGGEAGAGGEGGSASEGGAGGDSAEGGAGSAAGGAAGADSAGSNG